MNFLSRNKFFNRLYFLRGYGQDIPLMHLGLFALLGCSSALHPQWIYLFPLILLLWLAKSPFSGIVVLISTYIFTFFFTPVIDIDAIEGTGSFRIESIKRYQSPFQHSFVLQGKMEHFQSGGKTFRNIPCVIYQKKKPEIEGRWRLSGILKKGIFKPKKGTTWVQLPSHFSLAKWRFDYKEKFRTFFHKKMGSKQVAHFFASIVTGDPDDRMLAMEFRKVGLGHFLAISGLHFALVAWFIGSILRLFLPHRTSYCILICFLTCYYIFLGDSPSVMRAYIMITLYVVGLILNRRTSGLNFLGGALLIELILEPRTLLQPSFQLSFLATAGIFLFFSHFSRFYSFLLPIRAFQELKKMTLLDKHGYVLTSIIREGLALNSAVYLLTLPVSLYVFHCFPLLSIPYNLILTPLLSFSLLLLPFGLLFPFAMPLIEKFTSFLLQAISNPPAILNYTIYFSEIPINLVIGILTLIGFLGLTLRPNQEKMFNL